MVPEMFKIALRLRDEHVFRWQLLEMFNVFNTLTLKQVFWKTETFFRKLEYGFLIESTMIEIATIPFKTALSKANVNKGYKMDLSERSGFCP